MNVLQILPEMNVGGVETGTVDFAKYLVKEGHGSVVISSGGKLVQDLKESGSKHYVLPVHKKSLWTILSAIEKVRCVIENEHIDIVHARSRVPAWIAFFACRKTQASFITTCHGYYKSKVFSQVMGWSKIVIVPSMVIGRHMVDDFKVSTHSIRCVPRSVDLDKFPLMKKEKKDKGQLTITIIGRLTPLKGHKYFLRAMAHVVRTLPYVKILIVGDAPPKKKYFRQELETLAQRLGLNSRVQFLGNRNDIPDILAQTDVLVMSSVTPESFGRVILEAQAAGVPVVATQVGGVIDIIDDEKTGLLVFPKDAEGMAKAVLRVLQDRHLRQNLVSAARKKIDEKYTLTHMASGVLDVYEELLMMTNILVIKIGALGDVILITASLKALRKKFPDAKIHCLVGAESKKVLQNCPYLDGLIIYDHQQKDKGWMKLLKLSKKLRKYRFDKVIDFQNNRKSHLLAFLTWARERYGYDNGKWSKLLNHRIKNDQKEMAAVPHQFRVLELLNISLERDHYLELWPSKQDDDYAQGLLQDEWLSAGHKMVGINIAASEKWPTKNWPVEYLARLCDILSKKNIRVVITGVEKDKPKADQLLHMTKTRPAILSGKTDVLQLAAIIKRCQVFVTPDSAPMHIAAAMRTPFIVFFGPTDSTRHIPPAEKIVILDKKLSCAPCYGKRCRILTHVCMRDITPEDVVGEIDLLMGEKV